MQLQSEFLRQQQKSQMLYEEEMRDVQDLEDELKRKLESEKKHNQNGFDE